MGDIQRHINRFIKGMHAGIDVNQQSQETYTYSINGRLIFNDNGTWAWVNTKGTLAVFTLAADYGAAADYEPIGSAYVNGTLIVFSTNGINSEIGLVRQDQYTDFTYQTAFNDLYDPNGDLLQFSLQFDIVSDPVQENLALERVYWNDNFNEPRVFNILAGASFNYATPYPNWYSVHGMSQMPDLTWGLMKYRRNIVGSLLSGMRQYAYRYLHQTGYASPWSALTDFVFVTSKNIDPADWTKYDMGSSGINTGKGHEFEIKYLDQRFQQIEVAAVYWEIDAGANSASIIFKGDITGSSIIVTHTEDKGQEVSLDEIVQRFLNIRAAKTQGIHQDNYYHMGNIKLYPDIPIDTTQFTIDPYLREMTSDETGVVNTLPLSNQVPKNTTTDVRLFAGGTSTIDETYLIDNDYVNYKGTQWEHLFKGYFRRETIPFAIVLFNRKGQPLFAYHISDYTPPEQYNNNFTDARVGGTTAGTVGAVGDYILTNSPGGIFTLNIMGFKFGNIDLTDVLFDSKGDLQISGFSIVRMDRIASIVAQGVLCNTIRNTTDACNGTDETRPLPSAYNYLRSNGLNPNGLGIGQMQNGCTINARGFWHTFEAPDYFINPTLFETSTVQDKIRLVNACRNVGAVPGLEDFITELQGNHGHYYSKNYLTAISPWDSILDGANEQVGVSGFGNEYPINKLFANATNIDNISGSLFWRRYSGIQNYLTLPTNDDFSAIAHHETLLLDINGLNTSSIKTGDYHVCYYIANYLKPLATQQMTQSLLENRTYYNIGHFVPINATTLAAAFNAGTQRYVFNEVEVWGGDCYVDYWGYARLVPGFFKSDFDVDCDDDPKPDYAIGLFFPFESQYNHPMRSGVSYPKVGTEPMATYCGDDNVFPDGIYYAAEDDQRPEDYNVNSVLQAKDLINIYNAKRQLLNGDVTDFPLMEIYAGQKIYGEEIDVYRRFLVNNQQFANGRYGEIVCIEELLGNLYVYQRNSFARIRFRERDLVNTATGTINTVTGEGYQGHDYINTKYGTQHQFSVVNSGRSLYSMDAEQGTMNRFGQDGWNDISDLYDARWILNKLREYWYAVDEGEQFLVNFYDNPTYLGGVHGEFDFKNKCVVYTFTERKESHIVNDEPVITTVGTPVTIEYCEQTNFFQTYHGFFPKWYMQMKQNYFSLNPSGNNQVYMHDEGIRGNIYGVNQNSELEFVSNPASPYEKYWDNSSLQVVGDGIPLISTWSGITNLVALQTVTLNDPLIDNRPRYRGGLLTFPSMQRGQSVRLSGQYLRSRYVVANDGTDKTVAISSNEMKWRFPSNIETPS